jgi:hypothetical protein
MLDAIVAIVVRRQSDGWSWSLLNPAGTVRSVGFAGSQEGAMDAAWLEARQIPEPRPGFPDITVDYHHHREERAA